MGSNDVKVSAGPDAQPPDRLTKLADVARQALEADAAWQKGDRVFISVSDAGHGGFYTSGYDPPEGMTDPEEIEKYSYHRLVNDLVEHIEAVMSELNGGTHVVLVPMHMSSAGCTNPDHNH